MNEFSQLLDIAGRIVKGENISLSVMKSFCMQPRRNPQNVPFVVLGIKKAAILPLGLENYCGGAGAPSGRRVQAQLKLMFCAASGEDCWKLWEEAAERLIFSQELKVSGIECGEAAWQKDIGAVALAVGMSCEFIMSGGVQAAIDPQTVRVIRKGAV